MKCKRPLPPLAAVIWVFAGLSSAVFGAEPEVLGPPKESTPQGVLKTRSDQANQLALNGETPPPGAKMEPPNSEEAKVEPAKEDTRLDLAVWIPATVALGLATMMAMFAFVKACEKV